jgi:uncharacterized protein YoxC
MAPLGQALIVACVVVLTGVIVSTLLALRKTALRAESVMHVVERQIAPMADQIESLTTELRTLSRRANQELDHVSIAVRQVEDVSGKLARVAMGLSGFSRAGQVFSMAMAVKRGLDVFVDRLKDKH